ncbi:MAG: Gpi18-like mannosyltransferase [Saprospiraceae bacterium]|jgi:Gpi18-like mannosyltransferase
MPKRPSLSFIFWFLFILLFIGFFLFIPDEAHRGDIGFWKQWTKFILVEGFPHIYDYGTSIPTAFPCNYPPVILYFFKIYGMIVPDMDFLAKEDKYFKVIPLIFDFISVGAIFLLVKRTVKNSFLPLLLLLSPAFMYNSYLWGQMDSILTAFVALSLIFALRKKWMLAIIFFIIALNAKMQAIVFFPVLVLSILPLINSWKKLGVAILTAAVIQTIILLPFILHGTLGSWYQVMTSLVDQYTNVSLNAFNIWHLFLPGEIPLITKDYQAFWFGMTYKNWGLLFFFVFSFIALLPLFLKSLHYSIQQTDLDQNFKKLVFLSAFLCVLSFFFFNTQMHERYSHPAMLMAFLYGILSRNYWLYAITSIAYFLNLERTLRFFDLSYGTFIFLKPFIASLFLLALGIGIWQLYQKYPLGRDWRFIYNVVVRGHRE